MAEVLRNITEIEPTSPSRISRLDPGSASSAPANHPISDELETIVLKALSKDQDRRYQSAGELGRDLQHYLDGEPIEAKRDSQLYVLRKTLTRYRVQVGVCLAFLLLNLGSALAVLYTVHVSRVTSSQQTRPGVQFR